MSWQCPNMAPAVSHGVIYQPREDFSGWEHLFPWPRSACACQLGLFKPAQAQSVMEAHVASGGQGQERGVRYWHELLFRYYPLPRPDLSSTLPHCHPNPPHNILPSSRPALTYWCQQAFSVHPCSSCSGGQAALNGLSCFVAAVKGLNIASWHKA